MLHNTARNWPTPVSEDAESSVAAAAKDVTLTEAAGLWQTPTDPKSTSRKQVDGEEREPLLAGQARLWATPAAADCDRSTDGYSRGNNTLTGDVRAWPTPTAAPEAPNTHINQKNGEPAATGWRTPSGRDWKGESAESWRTRDTGDLTPTLADQVCSLPAPPTMTPGAPSSSDGPASRRQLNPLFVTWLMGWPLWWSLPEPIGLTRSGSQETAWCLYRRRMRGALSALVSKGAAE